MSEQEQFSYSIIPFLSFFLPFPRTPLLQPRTPLPVTRLTCWGWTLTPNLLPRTQPPPPLRLKGSREEWKPHPVTATSSTTCLRPLVVRQELCRKTFSSAGPHQTQNVWVESYCCSHNAYFQFLYLFSAAHCVCPAAVGDFFDPFGMGASSGVGSSVSSSRQASGPDLIGDLLGSDSSGTSEFPTAHTNPTPASNASLFDLSKHTFHCGITASFSTTWLCCFVWFSCFQQMFAKRRWNAFYKDKTKFGYTFGVLFFSWIDKIVNDTPKMTSSASQPDLLGGWDSWATNNTASMGATASKPSYTNTGGSEMLCTSVRPT